MAVLDISRAVFPDGFWNTVHDTGGSLPADTTYYYRVAAVNSRGEVCASASWSATTPAGLDDNRIEFGWNKVPGVKATGGYRIYRNTVDQWDSGSLFLVAVDTNSYIDDGSVTPSAGTPVKFQAAAAPPSILSGPPSQDESSSITINPIPGKEGGILQYQGSPPPTLILTGALKGDTAKTELDKLRVFRSHGNPLRLKITAYAKTWIDADYMIRRLSWGLALRGKSDAGAAWVDYVLELVEYVA